MLYEYWYVCSNYFVFVYSTIIMGIVYSTFKLFSFFLFKIVSLRLYYCSSLQKHFDFVSYTLYILCSNIYYTFLYAMSFFCVSISIIFFFLGFLAFFCFMWVRSWLTAQPLNLRSRGFLSEFSSLSQRYSVRYEAPKARPSPSSCHFHNAHSLYAIYPKFTLLIYYWLVR